MYAEDDFGAAGAGRLASEEDAELNASKIIRLGHVLAPRQVGSRKQR